jgi:hypothetical protein
LYGVSKGMQLGPSPATRKGLETPSNVLVVGRHMPLLRRIVLVLAETHENGIVVTLHPPDFYQMAPRLHIQNCFRSSFARNLVAVRRGAQQRLSGGMYVVWDGVLEGVPPDQNLHSILAQNKGLGLSNVVVVATPVPWMLPHFDRAIVAPGASAAVLGLYSPVPDGSYAVVDLRDLRTPRCEILPLSQENATV